MDRLGEVTKVDGKWLEITFCRPSDCDKCHACMGGNKTTTLRLQGTADVGDTALVSIPDSTVTLASLLAYGIPLVGLLAGMFIGDKLIPLDNSLGSLIGAVSGLALAVGCLLISEQKRRRDPRWSPQIKRIIHKNAAE